MKKIQNLFALFAMLTLLLTSCSVPSETPEKVVESIPVETETLKPLRQAISSATESTVSLAWTNPNPNNGVQISVTPSAGNLSSPVKLDAGVNFYKVTGLSAETNYTFTVTLLDSSKELTSEKLSVTIKTGKASVQSGQSGNQNQPLEDEDTTPPDDVTNLSVLAENFVAEITWTDSSASDLLGFEISYVAENNASRSIEPLEPGSLLVSKSNKADGSNKAVICDLPQALSYTFTVKAMDCSGNKSSGVSKTVICPIKANDINISDVLASLPETETPLTVILEGEISGLTITKIASALKENKKVNVIMDLSETTGLTEFPANAFYDSVNYYHYPNLKGFIFPDSLKKINSNAFYTCQGFSNVVIPDSVEEIGSLAFGYSYIESISLGKVQNIGFSCFTNCTKLKEIIIPSTVKSLGSTILEKCSSLNTIAVEEENLFYKSDSSNKLLMDYQGKTVIQAAGAVEAVTIPEGVTTIGSHAFAYCKNLSEIHFPQSIREFKSLSFYVCEGFSSFEVPEGVTNIGEMAFGYCRNLESVALPSTLETMHSKAFYECLKLKEVYLDDDNPYLKLENGILISSDGFNCYLAFGLEGEVSIPDGITDIPTLFCELNKNITKLVIPDSVKNIGGYMSFYGCVNLESVEIGTGIMKIGNSSFDGTSMKLKNVTIKAITPPELGTNNVFAKSVEKIFVPAASVEAYKTAASWKDYAFLVTAIE